MKLNEKKFICDLASILFAAGVLGCGALMVWSLDMYMHMVPLVFSFGALMFVMLGIRSFLSGKRSRMRLFGCLAAVLTVLCIVSVLFPGGF